MKVKYSMIDGVMLWFGCDITIKDHLKWIDIEEMLNFLNDFLWGIVLVILYL